MKKTLLLILITLFVFSNFACQNKTDTAEKAEQKEVTKTEVKDKNSAQYPHSATELKKWINDAGEKADKDTLKKLEKFTAKFSAGEIIRGIAVRQLPDYWDKVSVKDKLKTLSIMNTGFSKARIDAGYAESIEALNSTLYLEDKTEKIVAVSDSSRGAQIL